MTVSNPTILQGVQNFIMPQSQVAQCVFHATKTLGSIADNDNVDAFSDWIEEMFNNVASRISDEVSLGGLTLSQWDPTDEDWDLVGVGAPSVTFTNVDEMLPHGAAALVRCVSSDPDSVAAKYLPGFSEGTQDNGLFATAVVTDMALFGVDWQTSYVAANGITLVPGVFRRSDNVMLPLLGTVTANAIVAYQRRRKQGVGL